MAFRQTKVIVFAIAMALLAPWLAASKSAQAIPADGSEALIREGLALRRNGNDEGALEKFTQAATIRRSGRALAQIALAEQAIGRWIEAEAHLKEALALREEAWIAKNRPLLESALADISGHLGVLEISGNVAGAVVKVNGTVRGRLPLREPLRVPSGSLTVELEAEGHYPLARTVVILAGGRARESLSMVPSTQAAVPAFTPTPLGTPAKAPDVGLDGGLSAGPSSTWQRPAAIVSMVAAGVFAIYGGIAHWQREKSVSQGTADGCTLQSPGPSCGDVRKEISGRETSMMIGYGGAAAFAATGGLLLWVAPAAAPTESMSVTLFARGAF